jgi:DNA-binding MarR family transcriptional regulator
MFVRRQAEPSGTRPSDTDYEQLLAFRDQLRRFLRWSDERALDAGITSAQYQLLLAIRGHHGGAPTIGEVAEHLLLRHHSAVGLVDRAERAALVVRRADRDDQRVVRLGLTRRGARLVEQLAAAHLEQLGEPSSEQIAAWGAVGV